MTLQSIILATLFVLVTFINHQFAQQLGLAGVTSSYLIFVVLVTYYFKFPLGLFIAAASFLAINYFFIQPLYTWIGFLLVSVVISSLMRKLSSERELAEQARKRAEFAKSIAIGIAASTSQQQLFSTCVALINNTIQKPVGIAEKIGESYVITHQAGEMNGDIGQSAMLWAASSAKMVGMGTDDWPELPFWIIPFERWPSEAPLLLVDDADPEAEDILQDLRAVADQLCSGYQKLKHLQRARQAELKAYEESIQNTLLASISHDMRTPLTGIIGAAGTLHEQFNLHAVPEAAALSKSIIMEAEQLAAATENILSLVQLESVHGELIALDWQSPEEIVGILMARYRERDMEARIKPEINDNTTLIRAHATLLIQALINLVENALAVQPPDEPVIIRIEREDEVLKISVLDRGHGFPDGFDVAHIRKFANSNNKKRRGFGLGLAIVSAVASRLDADLSITPRLNGGSCVTLHFAVVTAEYSE
jgi:two-component system, OmpR family, sensor histidine kinase KdpD